MTTSLSDHQLGRLVGHLDADRRLAGNERLDPDRRGQRQREVGLGADDLAHRDARRRLQLVLGDGGAAVRTHHPGSDGERVQGALDQGGGGLHLLLQALALAAHDVQEVGAGDRPGVLRLLVPEGCGVRRPRFRDRPQHPGLDAALELSGEKLSGRHLRLARLASGPGPGVSAGSGKGGMKVGPAGGASPGGGAKSSGAGTPARFTARPPAPRRDASGALAVERGVGAVDEPIAHRGSHPGNAELHRHHQTGADQQQHQGRGGGAAQPSGDPLTEARAGGAGAAGYEQTEETQHRRHHQHAAHRGERSAGPGLAAEEPGAGEDQPGSGQPGADPQPAEQGVVDRAGDRTPAGEGEHHGEQDPEADQGDAAQLPALIRAQQRVPGRPATGRSPRGVSGRRLGVRPGLSAGRHDGPLRRGGRRGVGRAAPIVAGPDGLRMGVRDVRNALG